ncbi:ABC transporter substrate-binding protein [Nonomuraea rhodomycinica]|uniref:Extracellular solute-binding protein n=1 Tax=Nonomuraea rhodomycinica TaxID=1712872 RepID=A0A7Y6IP56_9ACTN|nr:extracellular solute-binding protein [Nonomuraea rhodomycinica]NUW41857.1 extracellular solute-binding protein [Nonomuraea rhodomycinica]
MTTSTRRDFLRIGVLGAGALASGGLLTSCGFVGGGGEDTGKLTLGATNEQRAPLSPILAAYEKQSGVTFEPTYMATDQLGSQIRTRLTSNTAPDLFRVGPGSGEPTAVKLLAPQGFLADLSAASWAGSMPAGFRPLCQVDGKTYALTTNRAIIGTFYNKKIFTELGLEPPTTWSELLGVCDKIKKAGKTPIALGMADATTIQFTAYALAATTVYAADPGFDAKLASGATTFAASAGWKEALEKILELNKRGFFDDKPLGVSLDQSMKAVASGQAAMVNLVTSTFSLMAGYAAGGEAEFGVFAAPGGDDAAKTMIPASPSHLFGVNAKSERAAEARKFLDFLAQPANIASFCAAAKGVPGLDGVPTDKVSPTLAPLLPFLKDGRNVPFANHTWPNAVVQQTLLTAGQQLFSGSTTVDDALKKMDESYQKKSS